MVATALEQWRRHRVDYRIPGLLAALLVAITFSSLPRLWVRWGRVHQTTLTAEIAIAPLIAKDEGLQILDVRVLGLPPRVVAPAPAQIVVPELSPGLQEEPALANPGKPAAAMEEFFWDPTHAYRLGKELLAPPEKLPPENSEVLRRRLEFFLSVDGVASLTVTDTSQAALARENFRLQQRRIFLRKAGNWAYQQAVARTRLALERMAMDNPLRGPQ